ncbi:hypothetical protein [Bradyrhizobium sp. Ghvi]|uniref:hypothetical protein n=1 Tax=Bradyrhizobium sp. Ghvi TaxID=1855319 RepID=UPI001178274D|nr:hypothetical protein [Bradyrhizobium sp. Ghvi]
MRLLPRAGGHPACNNWSATTKIKRLSGWSGGPVSLEAPAKQDGVLGEVSHTVVAFCEITQAPQSCIILAKQPLVIASQHAVDRAFMQIEQLLLKLG